VLCGTESATHNKVTIYHSAIKFSFVGIYQSSARPRRSRDQIK
jgi:hypothetical protein